MIISLEMTCINSICAHYIINGDSVITFCITIMFLEFPANCCINSCLVSKWSRHIVLR